MKQNDDDYEADERRQDNSICRLIGLRFADARMDRKKRVCFRFFTPQFRYLRYVSRAFRGAVRLLMTGQPIIYSIHFSFLPVLRSQSLNHYGLFKLTMYLNCFVMFIIIYSYYRVIMSNN